MLRERNYSQALLEQVNQVISDKALLVIQDSNSRTFLGRLVTRQTLDVRCYRGTVNYDPIELVMAVRARTPLVVTEAVLESVEQMSPYESSYYGEEAIRGGIIACGLVGPCRPWSSSACDSTLDTYIITGARRHLRFSGEVMKSVTEYDLLRLVVGSYGCPSAPTEVLMEVLPRSRTTPSLRWGISLQEAINEIAQ